MRSTNHHFRLSKSAKRLVATAGDSHARGELKKILIAAQVSGAFIPKKESRDRKSDAVTE